MKQKIRPMAREDKPAIMQILRDTPEFTPAELCVAEEVLDSYLEDSCDSGYRVLVVATGSSIVGYVCYGPTPLTEGTWDIYWLAVAPQSQNRGLGAALLASAESEIRHGRGRLALIETSSKPEYEKTRRFHRSQGYKLTSRVADFYAPGDAKLIFKKCLR